MTAKCPACGKKIAYKGRGRPRKYCETCVPSRSGGGAWREAWLAEDRDELEAERKAENAKRMTEWRASMRQHREQIARNRRALERRKQTF